LLSLLTSEQEKEFETELQHLNLSLKEEFMEVINPWVEKGRREGLQKGELIGLQKGKQEGLAHEQKVILKQLQKRFGSVPTEVEEGVKKLDLDGLESFAEAIFDFSSIDDLIVWLKK
jgi:predicted transposase YdaD